MQKRKDAGLEGCRKGERHQRKDAGDEGCRTAGQEGRDAGDDGSRTSRMQVEGLEGCRRRGKAL